MSETKKNLGGRPRVDATPITVRVPPELLAALDVACGDNPSQTDPPVGRPEMIRRILTDWLRANGYLPK